MASEESKELTARLTTIAETWARESGGRIRIAKNEADADTTFDPEAQEHLKVDERRLGRDLPLYGFMAEMGGWPAAIGDFADVAIKIQRLFPAAFEASKADVIALGERLPDKLKPKWAEIFETAHG